MTVQGSPVKQTFFNMAAAVCAAAIILLGTSSAASAILDSTFFRQSKFMTAILSSDPDGLAAVATDPRMYDVFAKFMGAVTAAYINFEMIPVNEANTFVAVFESLNDTVDVESFVYHGKTLTITGTASGRTGYFRFFRALEETAYFASVNGHQYITVDDTVRFEIECAAA